MTTTMMMMTMTTTTAGCCSHDTVVSLSSQSLSSRWWWWWWRLLSQLSCRSSCFREYDDDDTHNGNDDGFKNKQKTGGASWRQWQIVWLQHLLLNLAGASYHNPPHTSFLFHRKVSRVNWCIVCLVVTFVCCMSYMHCMNCLELPWAAFITKERVIIALWSDYWGPVGWIKISQKVAALVCHSFKTMWSVNCRQYQICNPLTRIPNSSSSVTKSRVRLLLHAEGQNVCPAVGSG